VALPGSGAWATMLDFLIERFPAVSRAQWLARMASGELVDQRGLAVHEARGFEPHMRLYYYRATHNEPVLPLTEQIVYRDDELLVVDKPHFLPVVPSGPYLNETLLVRLKQQLGIDTLVPVHRIDRETAGLVMFSLRPATRAAYQGLFREQHVAKSYRAIVTLPPGQGLPSTVQSRIVSDGGICMREEPGPPNAETHVHIEARQGTLARLKLTPVSGRKHQLRVHCAALGAPILFDRYYPRLLPVAADDLQRPLQLLASSLTFRDPVTSQQHKFRSARALLFPEG